MISELHILPYDEESYKNPQVAYARSQTLSSGSVETFKRAYNFEPNGRWIIEDQSIIEGEIIQNRSTWTQKNLIFQKKQSVGRPSESNELKVLPFDAATKSLLGVDGAGRLLYYAFYSPQNMRRLISEATDRTVITQDNNSLLALTMQESARKVFAFFDIKTGRLVETINVPVKQMDFEANTKARIFKQSTNDGASTAAAQTELEHMKSSKQLEELKNLSERYNSIAKFVWCETYTYQDSKTLEDVEKLFPVINP